MQINFYFKKTMFGMVLMIEDKKPGYFPGDFEKFWRKATESESQEIIADINSLAEQQIIIDKIKQEKPEFFI